MPRLLLPILLLILAAPARNLLAQACTPASLDVGGVVFADYDLDGTRDANEPAQRGDGLVINAYDCANALLASAPVATNGGYRLAGMGSAQGVRLELANLPAWLVESRAGSHSRTSVRFVTGGDCAVDFGVAQPSDFSGANTPNVLATCFVEGPFGGASAGLPALVRFERFEGGELRAEVQMHAWLSHSAKELKRLLVAADTNAVPPSGIEGIGSNDRGLPVELARCAFHAIGPLAIGSLKYKTEFGLFRAIQTSSQPALLDFTEAYAFALEELGRSKPAHS